jgi:hypothetical protein
MDLTDTSYSPGLDTPVGCSAGLPFATGATFVYQPAGQPQLSRDLAATQIAYLGQTDVTLFRAELNYDNLVSQGDLSLGGLHGQLWKRTASGLIPASDNSLLDAVTVYIGAITAATDSALAGDQLSFAFDDTVTISQGDRFEVLIKADISATAALGNYVVVFSDSTWLDMIDANLATIIYPNLDGATYPLLGVEISLVATGLDESFSNYPNPFNPDNGPTSIAYVLEQDALIDIELFTITGELVKRVADNVSRPAGPNQSDTWSGRNGADQYVVPGTYFCRITVRYADGSTETFRRKVGVVR